MKTIYVSRNQNGVVGIIPDDKFKMAYINILHFNGESIDGRSGPTLGRSNKEEIIYSFRNTLYCDIYEISSLREEETSFPEKKT